MFLKTNLGYLSQLALKHAIISTNCLWDIKFFLLGIEFYGWVWEFMVEYYFRTDVKHYTLKDKKDT